MKEVPEITGFMGRAASDARLGPMHLSLYLAILYCWLQQGGKGPVRVKGKELMALAKIGGPTPYYRTLRDLHEFGYIVYVPSFCATERSWVYLPLLEMLGYRRKN